jgi:hypothetical protein
MSNRLLIFGEVQYMGFPIQFKPIIFILQNDFPRRINLTQGKKTSKTPFNDQLLRSVPIIITSSGTSQEKYTDVDRLTLH